MGDKLLYLLIGFITFWVVDLLSIGIGSAIGSGPYEVGLVVAAISILSAIVVVCTLIIVDELKKHNSVK